ncbi:MAG: hypothetical protein AABW88_02450 [Nanoarchaeota archaeon]
MEKEWLYALLAVILIIVLLFVPSKIREVYNVFTGIGNEESFALTKLRADCTALIDNNEPIDRCALEVAEETLKAKGDAIIVEKWLRIQIEKGEEKYLKESLEFGRTALYSVSKDWVGALETYNLIYNRWTGDEVQLAIDEVNININIDKTFTIYDEMHLSESGAHAFNRAVITQNSNLLENSLKGAVKLYQKNKEKLPDKPLLRAGETCNTKYESTNLLLSSCIYFSRVSLGVGCYLRAEETAGKIIGSTAVCQSCSDYTIARLDTTTSVCSGYHNRESCEADPCDKGYCVWDSGSCTDKFTPIIEGNYWDLTYWTIS